MEIFYNNTKFDVDNTINETPDILYLIDGDLEAFKNSELGKLVNKFSEYQKIENSKDASIKNDNNNILLTDLSKQCINNMDDAVQKFIEGFDFVGESVKFPLGTANRYDQMLKQYLQKNEVPEMEVPENTEEDVEEEKLIKEELPTEDPIYKTALLILYKDGSASEELKDAIIEIAKVHQSILDMYTFSLYEDSWDEDDCYKFEKLLNVYNEQLAIVKKELGNIEWNYKTNKDKFFEVYKEIIKDDNYTYNRIKARHKNYKIYRANRPTIILLLSDIIGLPTISRKKPLEVEKFFDKVVEYCDLYPLYSNSNEKGEPTVNKNYNLKKVIENNREDILNKVNAGKGIADLFEFSELGEMIKHYVECRKIAYDIFNMCTSKRKVNGWNTYRNILTSYCSGDLSLQALKNLYFRSKSNREFDPADDYFQEIDQMNNNLQGIYESQSLNETWWDDDVEWYREHLPNRFAKDKIKKINMIPTDANVCKVYLSNNYVHAMNDFYPNDIIEICPTRSIDKSSLYSRDMRSVVIEVKNNEEWVIPFGYCQFYQPEDCDNTPNCRYVWDPKNRTIIIKALDRIDKGTKLIIKVLNKL